MAVWVSPGLCFWLFQVLIWWSSGAQWGLFGLCSWCFAVLIWWSSGGHLVIVGLWLWCSGEVDLVKFRWPSGSVSGDVSGPGRSGG